MSSGKGGVERRTAHVFDFGLDLDVRVDAEDEVLDRPAHARVAGRRLAPRGRLVRDPRFLARVLKRRRRACSHHVSRREKDRGTEEKGRGPQQQT